MTEANKRMILAGVEQALESVIYGKVIIELRGPDSPTDIVTEERTRYPADTTHKKEPKKREYHTD